MISFVKNNQCEWYVVSLDWHGRTTVNYGHGRTKMRATGETKWTHGHNGEWNRKAKARFPVFTWSWSSYVRPRGGKRFKRNHITLIASPVYSSIFHPRFRPLTRLSHSISVFFLSSFFSFPFFYFHGKYHHETWLVKASECRSWGIGVLNGYIWMVWLIEFFCIGGWFALIICVIFII